MTKTFDVGAAPHLANQRSVTRVMGLVLLALVPGVFATVVFFGPGVIFQIVLAAAFALGFEAMMLKLRRRPLRPFLTDLSAPLTAVLFALCLPSLAPWWLAAIGMFAAIVIGKHLYGGLGYNLFNPAMVGYVVVLICFPRELTHWLPPAGLESQLGTPGFLDSAAAIITGHLPAPWNWDALAQATPLDTVRELSNRGETMAEIRGNPLFGDFGGRGWEWIANFYALGGLFLFWKKIIPWQTPVATLGSVVLVTVPFWLYDGDINPFPLQHVFSGALVLAAFFIVTDPVSGCTTPRGRLIFGAGVGLLTLSIRRWGAYPDGVAFAVLLMNCAAPWIDLHTRPRIYGEMPPP
ncbi:MAG TPA: RnfABCDGE type electron transport complex subunit D [Arenimonas sp.]|uniref:RnfABCDGE type electron transport complex subunit D n=1 Tax=Arenimonas sp. TaxID=1872635 RepID=UPI002C140998|nr:RnfABCDGE type electron transport complex subunit D [Arenimonas sp.]HMB58119.1 RnfABCDGE type electron transport complex subunit D [Arenimonas sp.]